MYEYPSFSGAGTALLSAPALALDVVVVGAIVVDALAFPLLSGVGMALGVTVEAVRRRDRHRVAFDITQGWSM